MEHIKADLVCLVVEIAVIIESVYLNYFTQIGEVNMVSEEVEDLLSEVIMSMNFKGNC